MRWSNLSLKFFFYLLRLQFVILAQVASLTERQIHLSGLKLITVVVNHTNVFVWLLLDTRFAKNASRELKCSFNSHLKKKTGITWG